MALVVETTSVKGRRQVEAGVVAVCEQTETLVGLAVSADLAPPVTHDAGKKWMVDRLGDSGILGEHLGGGHHESMNGILEDYSASFY
jgi:hypothetical protein